MRNIRKLQKLNRFSRHTLLSRIRKRSFYLLCSLFFSCAGSIAIAAPADSATTEQVRQQLKKLFVALASGNPKQVEPLLAPEFQLVRADGSSYNKSDYLKQSIPKILTIPEFTDLVVTRHKDSIVVRLRLVVKEFINNQEVQSGSPQLFVFRTFPDGWKVVASANFAQPLPNSAIKLPSPEILQKLLGVSPETITVFEPHLAHGGQNTEMTYLGWPAELVFNHILGRGWEQQNGDIEFRALDGYVSRIDIGKFYKYRAYLVYGIKGNKPFVIDNIAQNERNVSLAPYYLVWDNMGSKRLIEEGASDWLYQVNSLAISFERKKALLPGNMGLRYSNQANLTQKHCLTCHQVNGYGGDKWPIDLLVSVRKYSADSFVSWILNPSMQKPNTTMPPLLISAPPSDRQEAAQSIYDYLHELSKNIK
jgi:hypothetical protein